MEASATLSTLLTRSWNVMRRTRSALLVGILAISFLSVLMQVVVGERVGAETARQVQTLLGERKYQQLLSEMRLDGATLLQWQEFSRKVSSEVQDQFTNLSREQRQEFVTKAIRDGLGNLFPILIIFIPLFILLLSWSRTFFLHLSLSPQMNVQSAVARTTQTFLPVLLLGACAFIASLIWVPVVMFLLIAFTPYAIILFFLALIPPCYLGPRFAMAPVLYLRREAGIIGSLEQSFHRSRGHYWKIVGNMLAAAVVSGVVLWLLLTLTDILAAVAGISVFLLVLYWARQACSFTTAAYITVFLGQLSLSLLESPQKMMMRKVQ